MNGGPSALRAHTLTIEEAQVQLETDLEDGLASSQNPPRAEKWGRNELDDGADVQPIKIIVHQIVVCNNYYLMSHYYYRWHKAKR